MWDYWVAEVLFRFFVTLCTFLTCAASLSLNQRECEVQKEQSRALCHSQLNLEPPVFTATGVLESCPIPWDLCCVIASFKGIQEQLSLYSSTCFMYFFRSDHLVMDSNCVLFWRRQFPLHQHFLVVCRYLCRVEASRTFSHTFWHVYCPCSCLGSMPIYLDECNNYSEKRSHGFERE